MQLKFSSPAFPITGEVNYLCLYDKVVDTSVLYAVLVKLTSQQTGYTKYAAASTTWGTDKERYTAIGLYTTRDPSIESLPSGIIYVGYSDFPEGFYDVTIYENSSNGNVDPTGLNILHIGVLNLYPAIANTEPVEYTEYTTNDADVESVYITNEQWYKLQKIGMNTIL